MYLFSHTGLCVVDESSFITAMIWVYQIQSASVHLSYDELDVSRVNVSERNNCVRWLLLSHYTH